MSAKTQAGLKIAILCVCENLQAESKICMDLQKVKKIHGKLKEE